MNKSPTYQLFMLIMSIYVLVVLFIDAFIIENPEVKELLQYIDFFVCLLFLADFFLNIFCTPDKKGYLKWGWLDFISSIPMIDPLRWARIPKIIRLFRALKAIKSIKEIISTIKESRFESLTLIVLIVTFMTFTIAACLILEFESGTSSSIQTAKDAIWWSFLNVINAKVSISEAQSKGGVIVTVVLNKLGLLLFAYFNAVIIAWLLGKKVNKTT